MCAILKDYVDEGRAEGRLEGENKLSTLIQKLIKLGRMDDISRVTSDREYREKLYRDLGVITDEEADR